MRKKQIFARAIGIQKKTGGICNHTFLGLKKTCYLYCRALFELFLRFLISENGEVTPDLIVFQ